MKFFNRKKEKKSVDEYRSLFINESDAPPARFGKSVYIRKEHHERISQIISVVAGSEVTIYAYIDNVLSNHFREFDEEIIKLFKERAIF